VGAVSTRATGCLERRESGDVSQAVRLGMAGPEPHLISAADFRRRAQIKNKPFATDFHGFPRITQQVIEIRFIFAYTAKQHVCGQEK
jgi:hypothetical protein